MPGDSKGPRQRCRNKWLAAPTQRKWGPACPHQDSLPEIPGHQHTSACCRSWPLPLLFSIPVTLTLPCPPAHFHTGLNLRKLAHDGQHSLHGAPRPQV